MENFLEEFLKIGNENESEFYPDGVKKPKYRTREESIRYCGRKFGLRFDPLSMTTKDANEFPCGIVDSCNGELPVCPKCVARRSRNRLGEFADRVDRAMANGDTLFLATAKDKKDMARIQKGASRGGYSYISFPTGVLDERVVILNGKVNGSTITPDREIKDIIRNLSSLLTGGRVSGKLGLEIKSPPNRFFPVPDVLYIFNRDIVSGEIYGQIEARAIFASSNMPMETENDVKLLIERRQKIIIGLLKSYDKSAKMITRGEILVDFDELINNIYIRKISEHGAKRMVDPDTKNAMEIIQGELVNFDDRTNDYFSDLGISM